VVPNLSDYLQRTPPAVLAAAGIVVALLLAALAVEWTRRRKVAQAAELAQGQLQTITASMRECVIAYDMDLRLNFANPAFERLTGWELEDLRDQEFLQYIHPDDRPALLAEWDRLSAGGALRDQEYRVVTRTGQVRWCASAWEPLRDEQGRQIGYLGTEFEITDRKLAEEAMRQDTELLQAIIEVQRAVAAAGLDSSTVMRVIAERSRGLTSATGVVLERIEGDELVPHVRMGVESASHPLDQGLSGLAVRTGELQRADDLASQPGAEPGTYAAQGIRSLLVVPLRNEQQTIGVLKVLARAPNAFTDRDAKALQLLGGLVGTTLEHAATFESRRTRLEERTVEVQESEQRFKQLVDSAREGIWVADPSNAITYVNPRFAEMLGHGLGELLGHPVFDFVDASSRASAQRALAAPTAASASHDLRFRRKDGSELWGLVSAGPITGRDGGRVGTLGMVTDITERKHTEDRLRRSAERFAMLHDLDQAILAARSSAEIGRAALGRLRRLVPCQWGRVMLFDPPRAQAQVIAGFAGDSTLSTGPVALELLAPEDALRRSTVRSIDDLTAVDVLEPALHHLAGEGLRSVLTVPLLLDAEPIGEITLAANAAGTFTPEHRDAAVAIAAPLAIAFQQARLREDLVRQTGELEHRVAERSAALRAATAELETLVYAVSHDLRDPLRHICGFSQLLLHDAGPSLDPAVAHYAGRISEGANKMGALLDDLIQMARVGRQEVVRRPVDLRSVVEDAASQLLTESDGRQIEWRVGELPMVTADPALVRLAVANLLSNALKFTRPRDEAVIAIRPIEHDGLAGIAVEDNGVGFKMAYAGKLFGLFQRLHRPDEFEGNGAGLALVQRVAQKHGGRVWAESELDRGATFFVTFGPPVA
jgi:PAS domain S-box-containing protein